MSCSLRILLCSAVVLTATPELLPQAPLVIERATVLAMDGRAPLVDHSIVIVNGRITSVVPANELEPVRGARVIDGAGRFVIPGLADMHVHLERLTGPQDLRLFVVAGVTQVRAMDGRSEHLDWRERVTRRDLLGPSIHTAGRILDGNPSFWDDSLSLADPLLARAAVREQVRDGYDFVKVYHQLDEACYRAILSEANELGVQVAGHVPTEVGLIGALQGGHGCIEHLRGYPDAVESDDSPLRRSWHWSKLYFAAPADPAKMQLVAARTREEGVWNCPTLIVQDKLMPLSKIQDELSRSIMGLVPGAIRQDWDPDRWEDERREQFDRLDDADFETIAKGSDQARAMVAALHRAGAGLLVGTDTPQLLVTPGFAVHEELELFVRSGLTPMAALRAATVECARFLGEDEDWGTIAAGKRADLLLLAGDPTADIRQTRAIEGLVLQGRWFDAAAIDALRRELRADAGGDR